MSGRLWILFALLSSLAEAQVFTVSSPSGKVKAVIESRDSIYYSVVLNEKTLIERSAIALLTNRGKLGISSRLEKSSPSEVRQVIENAIPFKRKLIPDHYSALTLRYKERFNLTFRVYDDGVAYRFETSQKDSLIIEDELASFRFSENPKVYYPPVQKRKDADIFHTSFEEPYQHQAVSEITAGEVMFSPILVERNDSKLFITESDLLDYPGMFLTGTSSSLFKGLYAPYPLKQDIKGGGFRQWVVVQRAPYLARVAGTRTYPWRVIGIAEKDEDLLLNDLVYRLATPAKAKDWSWVKPGMSTEEWICASNLRGVDFVSGINTATYKYYIDFTSAFGMPYVMLDAGWSENEDLLKITPGLDLRELAAYAKSKNVGLILCTLSMALEKQLEPALAFFSELGVKAIMTDFMDRDDQKMIQFYQRVAEATAQRKMMVFFHGAFKSAGFERTYPHCITREAALGSEYNIWSDKANPDHDLLLPFIRMTSGVMDYEPGFYDNATKSQFLPIAEKVMSQGTRTHQLAMFVVYESPLQMFSGNPSDAWKEPAYTQFLTSLPTTWDDTRVFDAALGKHILIGRQKGNDWYVGAMNNWETKDYQLPLSFLGEGDYEVTICQDGPNASRNAGDYELLKRNVNRTGTLSIHLAPGGGFVARLVRK